MMNDASVSGIVGEKKLKLGRESRRCYVVESTFRTLVMNGMTLSNGRIRTWIDKERGIILKQVSDNNQQTSGNSAITKMHQETTVISLDLSPIFAADDFTFTPPVGATLVDHLGGDPEPRGETGEGSLPQ